MDFIPLVAETLGGLAKDTIRMTRAIGKALGKRTNPDDPSTSTKHLFARLAIALWRGNACCWIHRTPLTHPSLNGLTLFLFYFAYVRIILYYTYKCTYARTRSPLT